MPKPVCVLSIAAVIIRNANRRHPAQNVDLSMSFALNQIRKYQPHLGLYESCRWTASRIWNLRFGQDGASSRVRPPAAPHRVECRRDSTDEVCFHHLFIRRELEGARAFAPPDLIMDLGANVGFASIYLMNLFPAATLIAIEPDPANFEVCRRNLAPYGSRVRLVKGGIWHSRVPLVLSRGTYRDGGDWSVEVREAQPGETGDVEGWDIPSLLALTGHTRIGLLKVDIEGSERALFSTNSKAWLARVDNIVVEIHDEHCHSAVFDAMQPYNYDLSVSGEYQVFRGITPK